MTVTKDVQQVLEGTVLALWQQDNALLPIRNSKGRKNDVPEGLAMICYPEILTEYVTAEEAKSSINPVRGSQLCGTKEILTQKRS